ncbi:MAG: hypothetical protein SV377_07055 [Halobacteria archaeon]|nr:hypothetical protein [Halobacteria archaeon]
MASDEERPRGIITPADRAFLRGEREFGHEQSRRNTRARIRKRIRNSILDFSVLVQHLDEKDREQIFDMDDLKDDERNEVTQGIIDALVFLYLGADDAGIPFELLLEEGVKRGEEEQGYMAEVDLELEVTRRINYDEIADDLVDRIETGERVPGGALRWLLGQDRIDPKSAREYIREVSQESTEGENEQDEDADPNPSQE